MTLFDPGDPSVAAFTVLGLPRPQGSVMAFMAGGKPRVAQGGSKTSRQALSSWREAVAAEGRLWRADRPAFATLEGPLQIKLTFRLQRPKSHPKTRRTWPTGKNSGDLDKLVRSALDALTGVLFGDDSQVIGIVTSKDWGDPPGCDIAIRPVVR